MWMAMCIVAVGNTIPNPDKGNYSMLTVTSSKASGKTTNFTVRENILTLMELFTLDSGKRISNTARARSSGLTEPVT